MNHEEFIKMVGEILEREGLYVRSYKDAGILCNNKGLVVEDDDGVAHQLEIPGSF